MRRPICSVPAQAMRGASAALLAACLPAAGVLAGPPEDVLLGPGLDCPPGATPEGEPCGENTNGQCESDPAKLATVVCGQTICGVAWADGAVRDVENFMLIPEGDASLSLSLTLTSEMPMQLWGVSVAGWECQSDLIWNIIDVPASTPGTLTIPSPWMPGDDVVWFILPDLFDGVPCGGGGKFGNEWVATWSCAAVPPPSCPQLGDADGSGVVDFEDLLAVLANFGPCP